MTGLGISMAIVPCYWVWMADWWQPWSSFKPILVSPASFQGWHSWRITLSGVGIAGLLGLQPAQLSEHQAQECQERTTSVTAKFLSSSAAIVFMRSSRECGVGGLAGACLKHLGAPGMFITQQRRQSSCPSLNDVAYWQQNILTNL